MHLTRWVQYRSAIDDANEHWHKVRKEKLKADNLAQQRASLESRIQDEYTSFSACIVTHEMAVTSEVIRMSAVQE